jgi:hypothetical protein
VLILISLVLYFLPSMVATLREKRNAPAIFVLNLLLGWSVIGWAVALVRSMIKDPPQSMVTTP